MLVMVVFFIAFRWIHLSTPLIRLFLLVLILLLMPTLNFLPVWFALDRKSGSAGMPRPISYAVFCLKKKYGPTFFAQTGVHGSHVTAGVLAMAYITRKAFKGGFTTENHEAVELVGLYWHFVDVVWIFLFTIVYLI